MFGVLKGIQTYIFLLLLWIKPGRFEFCIVQDLMTYENNFTFQIVEQSERETQCDTLVFDNITGSLHESILSLIPDSVTDLLITRSNLSHADICSPPNLRKISIIDNVQFPKLDHNFLKTCNDLSVLELSNTTLDHSAFVHLDGLQLLNIKHLNIHRFSNQYLDPLENLGFLRIEACEFHEITPETLCLPKVRRLNLVSNKVFPRLDLDLLDTCFNLESLVIVGDAHRISDNAFNTMASLRKLYIVGAKLETLTRSYFRAPVNLRLLHLSENDIKVVHSDAFQLVNNLEMLNLRYSKLEEIQPGTFENLRSLEVLDLTGNRLKSMDGIGEMPSLKKLDVSWNMIEKVDVKELKKSFTSLTQFVVFGNAISCTDKRQLIIDIESEMDISATGIWGDSLENCT